jgi:hypothetical protein
MDQTEFQKYLKAAHEYYSRLNVVPDRDDLVSCIADFVADDRGCEYYDVIGEVEEAYGPVSETVGD